MSNINYSKVLIGGVVAGIVWIAVDVASYMLMGMDNMDAWLAQHDLREPPMAVFFAMDLLFGLMAVWLYAAIRPRFGPGPRTAATAALFIWLLFTVVYFGLHMMGLFTPSDYAKSAAFGFVTVMAATMAGAWLYSEGAGDTTTRM
ncbi:MAG: hypothetical protein ACR2GJ_08280 [Gemmatimonadaceae bacterium]